MKIIADIVFRVVSLGSLIAFLFVAEYFRAILPTIKETFALLGFLLCLICCVTSFSAFLSGVNILNMEDDG